MSEVTKETITTSENDTSQDELERRPTASYQTAGYFIYLIFGLLDALLAFRFVFKLLGANPATGFVNFIYDLSAIFIAPFVGIFNTSSTDGAVVASIFEPATLVALIVYAVLAWGFVTLIKLVSGGQHND